MKNRFTLLIAMLIPLSANALTIGKPLKSTQSVDLKNVYPSTMLYDEGKLVYSVDLNAGAGSLNWIDLASGAIETIPAATTGCVFTVGNRQGACGAHSIAKYQNLLLLPSGANGLALFETATKTATYVNFQNEIIYSVDVVNDLAYLVSRVGHIFVYDLKAQKILQTLTLPNGYVARDIKVLADGTMKLLVFNVNAGDYYLPHPTLGLYDPVANTVTIPDQELRPQHLNVVNNQISFVGSVDDDDPQMDFVQIDAKSGAVQVRQVVPFTDPNMQWNEMASFISDRYLFLSVSYWKAGAQFTNSAIHIFKLQ